MENRTGHPDVIGVATLLVCSRDPGRPTGFVRIRSARVPRRDSHLLREEP
jgi:hypothetical protein